MKNNKKKTVNRKLLRIIILPILIIAVSCFLFDIIFAKNPVNADPFNVYDVGPPSIETSDTGQKTLDKAIEENRILREIKAFADSELASKLYHNTLSRALSTIAYDTATWLGSGGEGQKPLFIKEGWSEYLINVADNAAGSFIETLGKESGYPEFNLCEPSANAKIKINFGLYAQYSKRDKPDCTFSEMKNNWEEELSRPDFLSRFQNNV
jgi:hypothetical protein